MGVEAHRPRRLYRLAPDGFYVSEAESGERRFLHSDPFETLPGGWELGRRLEAKVHHWMVPVHPGQIVAAGRNYAAHAVELGNQVPDEPLLFLKATSSLVGPLAPIVLPAASSEVHHEGEIAVVLREGLWRASSSEARQAVLGVTAANDVTARDLQRRDKTFARGKSFPTFCPLGPCVDIDPDWSGLAVTVRVNGEVRQQSGVEKMLWPIDELLAFISRFIELHPADIVLTGTPEGVGELLAGDVVEVEVPGVGVLRNPVEAQEP